MDDDCTHTGCDPKRLNFTLFRLTSFTCEQSFVTGISHGFGVFMLKAVCFEAISSLFPVFVAATTLSSQQQAGVATQHCGHFGDMMVLPIQKRCSLATVAPTTAHLVGGLLHHRSAEWFPQCHHTVKVCELYATTETTVSLEPQ